jgi:transcriptional regulator with XRE-family HTH domain
MIGALIRQARKEKGLSQLDISKKLGLGSAQYISNIERGLCGLDAKHFKKVGKLLNLEVEDMIESEVHRYRSKLWDKTR